MGNSLGTSTNGPIISVEDARAHISDEEYRRLHAAFAGFKKPFITFDEFCYHVLGGAPIPEDKQKELFKFCSRNADTLSFENLLTALVGLCRIEHVQERKWLQVPIYDMSNEFRIAPLFSILHTVT
ncbi:hypothetical protein COOONC_19343, partial [Cooperia oncophora]